jgi:hypothetical protein
MSCQPLGKNDSRTMTSMGCQAVRLSGAEGLRARSCLQGDTLHHDRNASKFACAYPAASDAAGRILGRGKNRDRRDPMTCRATGSREGVMRSSRVPGFGELGRRVLLARFARGAGGGRGVELLRSGGNGPTSRLNTLEGRGYGPTSVRSLPWKARLMSPATALLLDFSRSAYVARGPPRVNTTCLREEV